MVRYMSLSRRATAAPSPLPLPSTDDIALHARVRVPNGRVGNVIGYYRGPEESVVVRYDGGDSGAFPARDLTLCA
jgi:hypothetical protein